MNPASHQLASKERLNHLFGFTHEYKEGSSPSKHSHVAHVEGFCEAENFVGTAGTQPFDLFVSHFQHMAHHRPCSLQYPHHPAPQSDRACRTGVSSWAGSWAMQTGPISCPSRQRLYFSGSLCRVRSTAALQKSSSSNGVNEAATGLPRHILQPIP